ncbi:hypothetical protein QJS04_geneDACA016844 [Acorus gramineus]|uniref:Uncharacterized protein n=1 Tax=Acorus gramineus TaxID=55184 RepID=A0AAV9ANP5_ACOGR|nr:hypothetical protein QJS04_geneDACA016844 [Acorus gramineus]
MYVKKKKRRPCSTLHDGLSDVFRRIDVELPKTKTERLMEGEREGAEEEGVRERPTQAGRDGLRERGEGEMD